MDGGDPRVYFAAERTLLAWLRTAIAIIGLGFLVARFGLFIALMRHQDAPPRLVSWSTLIGTGFVLAGTLLMAAAAYQHVRFSGSLTIDQRPRHYSMRFSVCVAVLVSVLGLFLAIYVLLNGHP